MNTTLIIMAAGIGSRLEKESNSWLRWDQTERLSWIIPFMMRKKQDLIKLSLSSAKIFSRSSKRSLGTGQAVLCCKDVVKEPFVIINADDYYGKEAFVKLHDFLVSGENLGR